MYFSSKEKKFNMFSFLTFHISFYNKQKDVVPGNGVVTFDDTFFIKHVINIFLKKEKCSKKTCYLCQTDPFKVFLVLALSVNAWSWDKENFFAQVRIPNISKKESQKI